MSDAAAVMSHCSHTSPVEMRAPLPTTFCVCPGGWGGHAGQRQSSCQLLSTSCKAFPLSHLSDSCCSSPLSPAGCLCLLVCQVTHLAARRQELLRREYMSPSGCPAQPPHGFKGQLRACWSHRLTQKDADVINRG